MATATTAPVGYVRKDMTSEEHLAALVAVLRTCQGTQIPVKLRLDSATGPLATGRIKAVHRKNGMEFATSDVPVDQRFGAAEAIWLLDIRNVYSVEAIGPRSVSQTRKEAKEAKANGETVAPPQPRTAKAANNSSSTRARATARA